MHGQSIYPLFRNPIEKVPPISRTGLILYSWDFLGNFEACAYRVPIKWHHIVLNALKTTQALIGLCGLHIDVKSRSIARCNHWPKLPPIIPVV